MQTIAIAAAKRKAQKKCAKSTKKYNKIINIEKMTKYRKNTVNWQLHKKQKESGENKSQMGNTKKKEFN